MPLLTHLDALRQHGAWADERLLTALRAAPTPVPAALRELAHIRGAQETWLARIEQRASKLAVWPDLSTDALAAAGVALDAAYHEYFRTLSVASLDRPVSYMNTAGQSFTTPLVDILLQVFSHGQYHRGKANVALRDAHVEPVGMDYIGWRRTSLPPSGTG